MSNDLSKALNSPEEIGSADAAADPSSRRDVILGGLAVVTTVTAMAGGAGEAVAQMPKPSKLFQVGFGKTPSLSDLQGTIKDIVIKGGCPTCGLAGFDIRFSLLNLEKIKGVEKVQGIEAPAFVRVLKP